MTKLEAFWRRLHRVVNWAAWRWARPDGPELGIALRIDDRRWLWRLNFWVANRYVPQLIARQVRSAKDSAHA